MPRAIGILVQIVLALFGLLALAFVPLFVAVASLTGASMQSAREASARSIGRAVAAQIEEARKTRSLAELESPLDAISAAARRVAAGATSFEATKTGPSEMIGLASSLSDMTAKLRADERRM